MHLGFIGLGHLGRAVAGRVLACGHTLSVYNRTPQRSEGLDAERCDHPRDVIEKCDVVLLCLFDSAASGGSIVNIASTRALMSEPHTEAYSASKGGR